MRRFNDSEAREIRSQRFEAHNRLKSTASTFISEHRLNDYNFNTPLGLFRHVAELIGNKYIIKDGPFLHQMSLLIPQIMSNQMFGNVNCRFSAALHSEVLLEMGVVDSAGLVEYPLSNPTHIASVVSKDNQVYVAHFFIKGPSVDFAPPNFLEYRDVFSITPDGLFDLDNQIICEEF